MVLIYKIGSAIGFNLIFIILCVIGFVMAAYTNHAWIPYGIGIGFNTISLIGRYRSYAAFGIQMGINLDVVLFVVLAIVFGILISKRRNGFAESSSYSKPKPYEKTRPNVASDSDKRKAAAPAYDPTKTAPEVVIIEKPTEDEIICPHCGCHQQKDRKLCWKCGAVFQYAGETAEQAEDSTSTTEI